MTDPVIDEIPLDETVKARAAAIIEAAGLTIPDAVRLMLLRTAVEGTLPFDPLLPNTESIAAMEEALRGDLVGIGTVEDLMIDLHAQD
jgi:DNA-damage-inducible protein J